MLKIATHDSATGEKGKWWTFFLLPFSRTQSKTLIEQYKNGCRMFDIRVKKYKGMWYAAHGLWISKDTLMSILYKLYEIVEEDEMVYISITYEGKSPNKVELMDYYHSLINIFHKFKFMYLAVKYGDESNGLKVKYSYFEVSKETIPATKQGFKQLDGRSWHTYLPIPWLWKKIYKTPKFNENEFLYVDFL